MSYVQLIYPNININARITWCLEYVDNAINAVYPYKSNNAQLAYNKAVDNGWVQNNYNFPTGVWFVLFWSLNNGSLAGSGHVALAYQDSNGNLQIHDSEVHSYHYQNRPYYQSMQDVLNWFSSGGISLTYLGWSIGCDGVKICQYNSETSKAEKERLNQEKLEREKLERERKNNPMSECILRCKDNFGEPFIQDSVFYWSTQTGFIALPDEECYRILDDINRQINGKALPRMYSYKLSPVHARLAQINDNVNVKKGIAIP